MPPVFKKPCVNNNNFSYSGKECSPLGKGYTADAEQVGTIMEGRDTTMWMVGIKNGVKVWNRVPTDLANDTAEFADLSKNKEDIPSPKKDKPKPTATKKKPTVKKTEKKPVIEVSESEDEDVKEDVKHDEEESKEEPKEEAKHDEKEVKEEPPVKVSVKKTPSKKNVKNEESKEKPVEKEKKVRKPTDFNIYMSYQIKIVSKENPELSYKDKFAKVASLWKELSETDKKEVLIKAKAAKE